MVAAVNKTCTLIDCELDVEPLGHHVRIDLVTCAPLAVVDAVCVRLDDLVDDLLDGHSLSLALLFHVVVLNHIVGQEKHVHFFFQNLIVFSFSGIFLNTPDKPPTSIPTVVSWVVAIVQQVGNHPVS